MHRSHMVVIAFLLLAACTAVTPPPPIASPTGSPTLAPAAPSSTALPSRTPTASPSTALPPPAPKPAGLRVVYFKGGRVTLWTEGKGARQLAEASLEQVRISDDGQVIAYLGYGAAGNAGSYGIFSINADGADQRLLVGQDYVRNIPSAERIVSFDFAPASHMVYFVTDQYDLHRVNADGGTPVSVFGPGKGGLISFSPDGRWMTLYHPRELLLARSDGSESRVAFQEWRPDYGAGTAGPEIAWERDSSGFHLVAASGPQGDPDNMTVWFIPVTGKPVKQMSYTGPYGENLSPDGRQVVYLYHQREPVEVHVVAADGKDTAFGSYASASYMNINFMGWSPDSKHFVLDLSKDGRVSAPFLCAVGEQPVKLTDTDNAGSVRWVDAQRVLFVNHGTPAGDALRIQRLGEPSVLVDVVQNSEFDYTYVKP